MRGEMPSLFLDVAATSKGETTLDAHLHHVENNKAVTTLPPMPDGDAGSPCNSSRETGLGHPELEAYKQVLEQALADHFQEQEKVIARCVERLATPMRRLARQQSAPHLTGNSMRNIMTDRSEAHVISGTSQATLPDSPRTVATVGSLLPADPYIPDGWRCAFDDRYAQLTSKPDLTSRGDISPKACCSPESSFEAARFAMPRPMSPRRKSAGSRGHSKSKMSATWQVVIEDHKEVAYSPSTVQGHLIQLAEWALVAEEPIRKGWLANVVLSRWFELCCALVIITNAGFTLWATDAEARYLDNPPSHVTTIVLGSEIFFLSFYTVEILLKLAVHRCYFFWCEDMGWNILDLTLVVFAAYGMMLSAIPNGGDYVNFVFVRTIRILKLAKILRVIRVMRFFAELRLMLNSLAGSFSSLFWSFVMLAFIFYIFGLMFVQGVAIYLADEPNIDDSEREQLKEFFGCVSCAMLSLYQAATGGEDWEIFYKAIKRTGHFNALLYIFYIGFIQIALLNILTGIFVENAMKLAQPDRETLALEQRKREIIEAHEMMTLCQEMDIDNSGTINAEELGHVLRSRRMRAHLAVLGLEIRDAEMFFRMLATMSDNNEVDIHSFVSGCMRMKGHATSLDLQGLGFQTALIHRAQKDFCEGILSRLDHLDTVLVPANGEAQPGMQADKKTLTRSWGVAMEVNLAKPR